MEELDIMELLYALKKRIGYIIVATLVCAIAGFLYTKFLITPMYKSSTTFVLSKVLDDTTSNTNNNENSGDAITQNDLNLNSKLVSTYNEILKGKSVAKSVIDSLNLDMGVAEFTKNISVSSKDDTEVIEITVSNSDPEVSANIANSLTEVFRDKVKDVFGINNLSVIDVAEPDYTPYNIGVLKNVVLFAFIGMFLSCGIVFVIVYFDDTIKDEKDIETLLNIPVIASIPKFNEENQGGKMY